MTLQQGILKKEEDNMEWIDKNMSAGYIIYGFFYGFIYYIMLQVIFLLINI